MSSHRVCFKVTLLLAFFFDSKVNTKARELDRQGNPSSRDNIQKSLEQFNERWSALSSQAEERTTSLQVCFLLNDIYIHEMSSFCLLLNRVLGCHLNTQPRHLSITLQVPKCDGLEILYLSFRQHSIFFCLIVNAKTSIKDTLHVQKGIYMILIVWEYLVVTLNK